ncbi:MAG: hypothetical protein AAGM22_13845 [Acidobacteriota bacterium]
MASRLRDIVIGAGHLRQQVAFYSANLGLRAVAKGRIPPALCSKLWGLDDSLDTVLMGRVDVPDAARLRLLRTSGLAARPDFDVTPPGPLGLVVDAVDPRRTYYRFSGAGVEFHAAPTGTGPDADAADRIGGDAEGESTERRVAYGRAYDGEYLVVEGPALRGTPSPYFGVTEPHGCQIVVRDLAGASTFFDHVLEQRTIGAERRGGHAWETAMGLRPGVTVTAQHLEADGGGFRTTLLAYSPSVGPAMDVQPPARGFCALRFDVNALEARLDLAQSLGARLVSGPTWVEHPALGTGWAASLMPGFGLLIELWQSEA